MPISKSIISKQAIEDTPTGDHGKRRRRCMQPMLGKMQDNNWAQVYCASHNGANGRSSRLKQSLNFNRGDREERRYRDKKQQREKSRLWEPTASCGDGRRETRNAEPLQERDNRDNREEAKLNFLAPQPLHHFRSSRIFILLHGFLCALQVHVDRETTGVPRGGRHTYYVHQRLSGEESGSTAAFYDRRSSSASSCESGLRRRDVSAHFFVPRLDLYPEIPLCAHTQVLVSQGAERLAICARPDARRTSR